MKKDPFFEKKIGDKYIVYNSIIGTPTLLTTEGYEIYQLIKEYKTLDNCIDHLSDNIDIEELITAYNYFAEADFFNTKEISLDMTTEKTVPDTPKQFYFHLTDRCNLKCTYCYNDYFRNKKIDLALSNWKIIIDKIKKYLTKGEVILTGGEALLYKDILQLIKYLREACPEIRIKMFSNASLHYPKLQDADKIFQLINKVALSVDSIDNSNHERVGFSMDNFKENIDWIIKNNFQHKITIISNHNNSNYEAIKKVKQFAEKNNFNHYSVIRVPNKKCEREIRLMPNPDQTFSRTIGDIGSYQGGTPFNVKCGAGTNIFSIDNNGNCFPCQAFHHDKYKLGNILDNDFETIINSKPAKELQTHSVQKQEGCKDCNLKYVCGGGCIADTFRLEGSIKKFPETLCAYYKSEAINSLCNLVFET